MSAVTAVKQEALRILDPQTSDAVVADNIIAVCPKETYSSIFVHTGPYHFLVSPKDEQHQCRIIQLQNTPLQKLGHFLSIFYPLDPKNLNLTVNSVRVLCGVTGSTAQKDRDEVFKAYTANYTITICAAMDNSELLDCICVQDEITHTVASSCIIL